MKATFSMRGQRSGLGRVAQADHPCPCPPSSTACWPPTTHPSLWRAFLLLNHLRPPPPRTPGLGPVRQRSSDSYKNKSSPAQFPGLKTHLAELSAGLAPGRLAKGSVEQVAVQQLGAEGLFGVVGYLVPSQLPTHPGSCSRDWPSPFPSWGPPWLVTSKGWGAGFELTGVSRRDSDHSRAWFMPVPGHADISESQGRHLRTGRKFSWHDVFMHYFCN